MPVAIPGREELAGAVAGIFHESVPLRHLAFLSHRRSRAIFGRRVPGVGRAIFPIAPHPVLSARTIIQVGEIPAALKGHANKAVQGTVAGSGEVLLLALDPGEG